MKHLLPFLATLAVSAVVLPSRAAGDYLKPDDVIALVGGEDMVAAGEYGYIETFLHRAFPDYHLKFRNLAWEGDTVFEQARMLNYPPLERQLEEIGATVVIVQFGQMESVAGESGLPAFTAAYGALLHRISGAPKRRIVLVEPTPISTRKGQTEEVGPVPAYWDVVGKLSKQIPGSRIVRLSDLRAPRWTLRDDRHLDESGQVGLAGLIARSLGVKKRHDDLNEYSALRAAISKKNRLWERYRRPQNWAFLAGDRITQASSRDHQDPTRRWFPEEMKEFVPLIEAKDREIWALAAELTAKKK